ncbi:hypothetical protein L6164_034823 [Bauhinia variegata]|uniref:Uncharacterized protein n=1 Tax=Bauhinia variegata TaxID=167791 RepID=A0ACB9KVX0_BAUVA|nr:hypothetical protein L6164_034823 [Bauhinia variegata]
MRPQECSFIASRSRILFSCIVFFKAKRKSGKEMASFSHNSCLFISLVLLFCNAHKLDALDTAKSQNPSAIMQKVCAETRKPNFCLAALSSIPKAGSTGLEGLGFIAIQLTIENATDTLKYID